MTAALTRGERVTRIFDEACRRWSVDLAELRGPSRLGNLIPPRAAIVVALRQLTPEPLSYPVIGEKLGGRDHSAAHNLAHRGHQLARRSTGYRAAVDDLIAIARGAPQGLRP
ncbi:helix-turn-helix domain-containing protein [Sphingopyxis sp. GW247-27LB]|uniref:helix-turn-helix domain-containing protein n=1 Tax=Sphingopyxis sp. GW247-27LB TaxID=2012632 RepID=UPI001596372A|nr:helix-turn-helix domain-containing protein [Sphingopyxis sp. GW247-27LB]